MDCRNKVLNPHTCVFVKECKPGFKRNENYQCRKDTNGPRKFTKRTKLKSFNETKRTSKMDSTPIRKFTTKRGPTYQLDMPSDYDEDTIFVFYSKSANVAPGKGKNEKLPEEKEYMYEDLEKIPNWRKRLSNFWLQSFKLDGMTWASVEHYYQGSKFKINNNAFYRQFSLDSGSELSKDPVLAKSSGGKDLKHKYRSRDIQVDPDFFTDRVKEEMYAAQKAKFTQNPELTQILKATKRAKLMHYTRGGKLETFNGLMYIRDHLK